jgi:hypothetical protein
VPDKQSLVHVRGVLPRLVWTRTLPGGDRQRPTGPVLFVHYSASAGLELDTGKKQRAALRSIRDYHTGVNGWSDIGYNFVVCQPAGKLHRARIYRGRGARRVPAAQLGHNTGNLAVCVIAAAGEPIATDTVLAVASLARRVRASAVKGHRDVNDTSCPGDGLYDALPTIRRLAGL